MQSKEAIEKQIKLLEKEFKTAKDNNEYFTVNDLRARINTLNWMLGIYEVKELRV